MGPVACRCIHPMMPSQRPSDDSEQQTETAHEAFAIFGLGFGLSFGVGLGFGFVLGFGVADAFAAAFREVSEQSAIHI